MLGFPSEQAYDVAVMRYRQRFQKFTYQGCSLADVAAQAAPQLRRVVQAVRKDPWQDFIELFTPLVDWEKELANRVRQLLRQGRRSILVAYYPPGFARLLTALGERLKVSIGRITLGLGVFVASPWEDLLCAQFDRWQLSQAWAEARDRLGILLLFGAADFPDLPQAMCMAGRLGLHMLAQCPDLTTAELIELASGPTVHVEEAALAPWSPFLASAGFTHLPLLAQNLARATLVLEAPACFSALHRRPTAAWLEAITGVPADEIRRIAGEAPDWIQSDPATDRFYWASEDGAIAFLETRFGASALPGSYAEMINRLALVQPPGWERAVVNLLKSMY